MINVLYIICDFFISIEVTIYGLVLNVSWKWSGMIRCFRYFLKWKGSLGLLRNLNENIYLMNPRPQRWCELLFLLHWFNLVCLGPHLKLVLMLRLLFFRNRWLVCLKLCNGKSWWVPSCSLWFVECSVNAVERAVDPLILLYIHCVYGVCLSLSVCLTQDSKHTSSQPQSLIEDKLLLPKLGLSGFSQVCMLYVCVCVLCCWRDGSVNIYCDIV